MATAETPAPWSEVPERPSPTPGGLDPQTRRLATVVIAGATMSFLDSTIVNVALESLSRQLHASIATIQWVVTGYLLALATAIPVTGWLVRRFSARVVFMTALALFTLGSGLSGLANSPAQLIAFRVLQGLGGGMIMPVGQMILARSAGPKNMARVMAVIGVPIVLAPVFGPTLGGLIIDSIGWRWIFFVNVPIGLVGLALAARRLPREPRQPGLPLDAVGLVCSAGGSIALTYGLSQIGAYDLGNLLHVIGPVVLSLLLLAAFVVRSLRVDHPLLDLSLYRNSVFAAASVTTFCIGLVLYGGVILMPLYYQIVRHESPVATGLLLAPGGIGAAIANRFTARVTERLGNGRTILIGATISTVATLPFALIGAHTPYWLLGVGMTVRGIGMGLMIMPSQTAAYRVLDRSKINDATPQLSIQQRVGGSIGVAVLTVVLQHHLARSRGDPAVMAHAFGIAFWWVVAISIITVIPVMLLTVTERRGDSVHH